MKEPNMIEYKTYDFDTGKGALEGIMDYENGEMDEDEVIDFFQGLVNTGIINHLQGSYQRIAMELLSQGMISHPSGFEVEGE
jgi:hypothetical protein